MSADAPRKSIEVIHLVPHLKNVGNGIVNAVVDLAIGQARAGAIVEVYSSGGHWEDLLASENVKVTAVPMQRLTSARHFLRARRALKDAVGKNPKVVVHCHTLKTAILALSVVGSKHVQTVHNPWSRFAFTSPFISRRLIVLSQDAYARFSEAVRRFRLSRRRSVTLVENGVVGSPRYPVPQQVDLARPAIVTVAGLYERKGIQHILDALSEIDPGAHLYVIGDGPFRSRLEDQAREKGLQDRVHMLGFRGDALNFIAASDIFVLYSHDEGGALVLSEARMVGAAIVASNVGGIPSMLKPDAGMLVEPKNAEALANVLKGVLADSSELDKLRSSSQKGIERYSFQRVAREILDVYE